MRRRSGGENAPKRAFRVVYLQSLVMAGRVSGVKGLRQRPRAVAEALFGLARAFFYAKGRALLASHSDANSEAAVRSRELKANPACRSVPALDGPSHDEGQGGGRVPLKLGTFRACGRRWELASTYTVRASATWSLPAVVF